MPPRLRHVALRDIVARVRQRRLIGRLGDRRVAPRTLMLYHSTVAAFLVWAQAVGVTPDHDLHTLDWQTSEYI